MSRRRRAGSWQQLQQAKSLVKRHEFGLLFLAIICQSIAVIWANVVNDASNMVWPSVFFVAVLLLLSAKIW